MAGLKPIRHGGSDPCAIPSKCKECSYFLKEGSDFPKCSKREDGKLIPEVGWDCFRRRVNDIILNNTGEPK